MKARLILPLDPYVKAYGWDKWYSPSTWSIFRWTNDGKTFGQGPTWGVAQTGQNVSIYVNTKKLAELGFDPNAMPTTFDDFDQMLADVRAKLPKDDPVIEAGNQEGYGYDPLLRRHPGRLRRAAARPRLDHARARLDVETAADHEGARDAPVVGQERLPQR